MINVRNRGYTILEVLIVIAVSASMFVVVAISFGGRQQQVQFTQAVRDFDSQLRDIANDVSTGYFPESKNIVCTITGGANPKPIITVGVPPSQGTNEYCISIGKVIQFSPAVNNGSNDNRTFFKVYNMVGLRNDNTGSNPTSLGQAVPTAIPEPITIQLKYGLKVKKIISTNPASTTSGAVAIFSSLNRSNQIASNSTSEDIQIGVLVGTVFNMSEADLITEANKTDVNEAVFASTSSAQTIICVESAFNDKMATIAIGGNMSGTVLNFDDVAVCGP